MIEGQQADGGDIPDVSSKWVRLNDNLIDSNEFSHVWLDSNGNIVLGLQKDGSLVNKSFHKLKNDVEKLKPLSKIVDAISSFIEEYELYEFEYINAVQLRALYYRMRNEGGLSRFQDQDMSNSKYRVS